MSSLGPSSSSDKPAGGHHAARAGAHVVLPPRDIDRDVGRLRLWGLLCWDVSGFADNHHADGSDYRASNCLPTYRHSALPRLVSGWRRAERKKWRPSVAARYATTIRKLAAEGVGTVTLHEALHPHHRLRVAVLARDPVEARLGFGGEEDDSLSRVGTVSPTREPARPHRPTRGVSIPHPREIIDPCLAPMAPGEPGGAPPPVRLQGGDPTTAAPPLTGGAPTRPRAPEPPRLLARDPAEGGGVPHNV
jgi:hypothetical protein